MDLCGLNLKASCAQQTGDDLVSVICARKLVVTYRLGVRSGVAGMLDQLQWVDRLMEQCRSPHLPTALGHE